MSEYNQVELARLRQAEAARIRALYAPTLEEQQRELAEAARLEQSVEVSRFMPL